MPGESAPASGHHGAPAQPAPQPPEIRPHTPRAPCPTLAELRERQRRLDDAIDSHLALLGRRRGLTMPGEERPDDRAP